ncbi:hypothetical protein C8R45DRAFT_927080 [Mycena sanguinolenta]|nr:hypothetical protein C8R45DRAFT_927080 [Mycena sanguinolenta]
MTSRRNHDDSDEEREGTRVVVATKQDAGRARSISGDGDAVVGGSEKCLMRAQECLQWKSKETGKEDRRKREGRTYKTKGGEDALGIRTYLNATRRATHRRRVQLRNAMPLCLYTKFGHRGREGQGGQHMRTGDIGAISEASASRTAGSKRRVCVAVNDELATTTYPSKYPATQSPVPWMSTPVFEALRVTIRQSGNARNWPARGGSRPSSSFERRREDGALCAGSKVPDDPIVSLISFERSSLDLAALTVHRGVLPEHLCYLMDPRNWRGVSADESGTIRHGYDVPQRFVDLSAILLAWCWVFSGTRTFNSYIQITYFWTKDGDGSVG